jgi:hypothetical protein
MFTIGALLAIGLMAVTGVFNLGLTAWIIAAVLLGIGAIIDYCRKGRTS